MEKTAKKQNKVLNHLMEHKSITPREAITLYDYWRLSDCIFKLKRKGHDIRTELVHENGITYAKYHYNQ